jgi:hypothetical protein
MIESNTSTVELLFVALLVSVAFGQQKSLDLMFEIISAASLPSLRWTLILLVLVFSNLKNIPGVYHLRLLNAIRFVLRSQRTKEGPKPEHLFQPIITSSTTTLMELDLNLHKSNSTYFSDIDIARTHLVCTLFSKGIEKARGGTASTVNGKLSTFNIALGAVSCSFQKELKPYEPYEMWTKILTWDKKWLYIVTHFVKKDAGLEPRKMTLHKGQNTVAGSTETSKGRSAKFKSAIAASALSKVVFKTGRITISPEVMLEASGLLPARPVRSEAAGSDYLTDTQIKIDTLVIEQRKTAFAKATQNIDDLQCSESVSSDDSRRTNMDELTLDQWRWDVVENERVRGLEVAGALIAQSHLENELNDSEALGRHTDGCGIAGVVLTLAQLANLSSYQFL